MRRYGVFNSLFSSHFIQVVSSRSIPFSTANWRDHSPNSIPKRYNKIKIQSVKMELKKRKITRQLSNKSLRRQVHRIAEFHAQREMKINRTYFNNFDDQEDEPPYEEIGQIFVLSIIFIIVLIAYLATLQGTGF